MLSAAPFPTQYRLGGLILTPPVTLTVRFDRNGPGMSLQVVGICNICRVAVSPVGHRVTAGAHKPPSAADSRR